MSETKYRGTKERAQELRSLLKRQHGWTGRQVSVRTDNYSMGSTLRVEIKDPSVPLPLVERLAEEHESVRRCEITHDILSGGNRYVSVSYSSEARQALAAPLLDDVQIALDELDTLERGTSALIPVGSTGYLVGRSGNGWSTTVWAPESAGCLRDTTGAEGVALEIAFDKLKKEHAA